MKPKAHHRRRVSARKIRTAKDAIAAEVIGTIEKNSDIFVLTYGQFSLIDALAVILDQTGTADVGLATWTAADADLQRALGLLESARMRSFRLIIDGSFDSIKPYVYHHMQRLFGDDRIRCVRTHAKFIVVSSDTHDVAVRTSMNLNENSRMEQLEIAEDSALCAFLWTIVDSIFEETEAGVVSRKCPVLEGVPETVKLKEVRGDIIRRETLRAVRTTHVVGRSPR